MKKFILILALALLLCGCTDAATKIGLDRLNWSQSIDGIKFSGTAPASTTGKLYNDSGTLKFNGSEITGGIAPCDAQISKSGSNTILNDRNGTEIISSSNAGGVINYAINHSYHSIYIHPGNYSITESIDLRTYACHLEGAGKTTILYGSVNPIVNIYNTGSYYGDVGLSNLWIKGAGTRAYDGVRIGRVALDTELMRNVYISNCKDGIWIGSTCFGNDYYSVDVSECYQGIIMNSTDLTTTQRFWGGAVRSSTRYGVKLQSTQVGNLFTGMIIEYNGNNTFPNLYISTTNGAYLCFGNIFRDCWFEDDTFMVAIGGTDSWVSARMNVIENCHFVATADGVQAFKVIAGRRNVFKGNMLDSNGHSGAKIDTVATNAVNNIIVENVDDGSVMWSLTDAGTGTVTTPNYWG